VCFFSLGSFQVIYSHSSDLDYSFDYNQKVSLDTHKALVDYPFHIDGHK
jgi:hypothetical protein